MSDKRMYFHRYSDDTSLFMTIRESQWKHADELYVATGVRDAREDGGGGA